MILRYNKGLVLLVKKKVPTSEKLAWEAPELVKDRVEELRAIFPEAVCEGKVDFEKLKAALGEEVEGGRERYTFSWAGKRDGIRLLQTPSRATLLPCPEESVSADGREVKEEELSADGCRYTQMKDESKGMETKDNIRLHLGSPAVQSSFCRDTALCDELAANLALQCRLKTV